MEGRMAGKVVGKGGMSRNTLNINTARIYTLVIALPSEALHSRSVMT